MNQKTRDLVEEIRKNLYEEAKCESAYFTLKPEREKYLHNVTIQEFRALLAPYKIKVSCVKDTMFGGYMWAAYKENNIDALGLLKTERKDI